MLSLPSSVRIFLSRAPVDFRKAHDGLHAIVREQFGDDPHSGHVFVFLNRRVDRVKLLVWDRNGFWLLYKRRRRISSRTSCGRLRASRRFVTGSMVHATRSNTPSYATISIPTAS
jgi:hypothetical protein